MTTHVAFIKCGVRKDSDGRLHPATEIVPGLNYSTLNDTTVQQDGFFILKIVASDCADCISEPDRRLTALDFFARIAALKKIELLAVLPAGVKDRTCGFVHRDGTRVTV